MSIEKEAQELHGRFESLLKEAAHNEITLKKFQAFELALMNASSLNNLVDILLKDSRGDFGWDIVTLTLVDPEYEIQRLLECSGTILPEHPELIFVDNGDELENMYHQQLFPILETYHDDYHHPFFSSQIKKPDNICLLPLSRNHHLVGSYNIGKHTSENSHKNAATDFLQHLAAVISVSLETSITKEHLQNLGLIDPLTGVNNRRFFDQRLIEEVAGAIRDTADISCLFIDIDYFKKINDNYGHQIGDKVLKDVAKIIRKQVRTTDVVARYGGEEFTVLLSHKGKQKAKEIAERIREMIEKCTFMGSQKEKIAITTSIGINTLNIDEHEGDIGNIATLFVEHADRALYQAKNNGRNRIEVYTDD